jgi:two-component system nitrogen regulation sensor histidine kinase NtrY
VSIDVSGTVATVNPAAGAMLGINPEKVCGCKWEDVFAQRESQQVSETIRRISEGGAEKIEQQIRLTAGVRELTAWMTATTLSDENGARLGIILFFEDVSHLLRVERMEAWREVARRIAHEIKNPLTPIQLSAQRLQKRYGAKLEKAQNELLEECTNTIIGQVEQLKRLVNEFSTFARLPAIQTAPNDLNEIVEQTLVLFREGHRDVSFEFYRDPFLPKIEIDRDAVKRAIVNVIDNAVAACHQETVGQALIEVTTLWDKGAELVRLEVVDNGPGMPPAVKARAFEPYFSTKRDGTGLGLAIVSAIVADHRAYIRLRDNKPHGTRLVIEFPLRQSNVAHTGT